jgi:hypothetical protein
MTGEDDVTAEFRAQLRDAVEDAASLETDWAVFHARLNDGPVSSRLRELRRRASGGYRATAAAGAAWWDYAARAALAAVPLGLAAALLLLTYLRSGSASANDRPVVVASVASAHNSASARAAFESVLTGDAAPRAAMDALIPVPANAIPANAIPADSAGGSGR